MLPLPAPCGARDVGLVPWQTTIALPHEAIDARFDQVECGYKVNEEGRDDEPVGETRKES